MGPLVPVHVAIGCEGLTTKGAGERALSRVDQHVPVQGAKGGQHLVAEAAVVDLGLTSRVVGIRQRLDLIVSPDVLCELLLRRGDKITERTLVLLTIARRLELLVLTRDCVLQLGTDGAIAHCGCGRSLLITLRA